MLGDKGKRKMLWKFLDETTDALLLWDDTLTTAEICPLSEITIEKTFDHVSHQCDKRKKVKPVKPREHRENNCVVGKQNTKLNCVCYLQMVHQ